MIKTIKEWKRFNENVLNENLLVPRNIEGRKEKLRQYNIELLGREVIEGDLKIDESFEGIPEELVKVKEITGDVRLTINKGYIPSWLKNVKIYGKFSCSANNLTSLENCPQYVGDSFYCSNNKLTSLEGCPKYIGGEFNCYNNTIILQLPKGVEVVHSFYNYVNYHNGEITYINENILSETILVPRNIEGRKDKLKQDLIKLLSQEVIEGDLDIDESFLEVPDEMIKVKEIKGTVCLYLEGIIPTWLKDVKVYGSFDCSYCNLITLENCPQYVGKKFACVGNKLISLEDCPKYIGGNIFFDKGLTLPKDVEINGNSYSY